MNAYTSTYDMNAGDVIKAVSVGNTKRRKYVVTRIYDRTPNHVLFNVEGQDRVVCILNGGLADVEIISRHEVAA